MPFSSRVSGAFRPVCLQRLVNWPTESTTTRKHDWTSSNIQAPPWIQNRWPTTKLRPRSIRTVGLRRSFDLERASIGCRRCCQSTRAQKRWLHSLVSPRTFQNRWLTAMFQPRTLKRWVGTMLPPRAVRIVGFQRYSLLERASVGFCGSSQSVLSKTLVRETDVTTLPNSNREAFAPKRKTAHANDVGRESLHKRK